MPLIDLIFYAGLIFNLFDNIKNLWIPFCSFLV